MPTSNAIAYSHANRGILRSETTRSLAIAVAIDRCLQEASFSPTVKGCRGNFDFTAVIELIWFSIVPAAVFMILSAVRLLYLARKPIIIRTPTVLLLSKLWLDNSEHIGTGTSTLTAVFTAAIAIKFIILILESLPRATWHHDLDRSSHSPEETTSIFSLALFSWMNPLLWQGYQRPLDLDDLYPFDRALSVKTHCKSPVAIHNGEFGWTSSRPIFKDINISIPSASVTTIVGPVASGKSELCKALLGELPPSKGEIAWNADSLGSCDQVPFLFNATIRENIIGFSSFDSVRYGEALDAAMLVQDLDNIPSGDGTKIGNRGISLSGGQEQRVSLARALYHNADLLVLDDVFSGLDNDTQDQISKRLFRPNGPSRKRGTTVIFCTHAVNFLAMAYQIVALDTNGGIVIQSSSRELVGDEPVVQKFSDVAITQDYTTQDMRDCEKYS
ncbi:hypothetical protein BP6252_06690 [Coleophoma cylindrospora]|uniref:ABC transporter domain-containing protein n=1 Tax=Coleophoma cylindrospora TaxID=1849047 RepID=A0A3D8RNL6_9HELO|nr:hypothetical protein BP6252_06690 [Coleophoma cylindrospora]